jgi:hypothetical protein
MPRGEKASPNYVNPYEPPSLVSFVARTAILSEYESYSELVKSTSEWNTVSGLSHDLNAATRRESRIIENLVNRRNPRWHLTSFYDAVVDPDPKDDREIDHTEGELPARYLVELVNAGPSRSKPEANVRGMAMRSFLIHIDSAKRIGPCFDGSPPLDALQHETISSALLKVARDLAIVACSPPTSGGSTATRLLAEAGTLALQSTREHVLSESPVAWRLTRVISELLKKAPGFEVGDSLRDPDLVTSGCEDLLRDLHEKNPPCVYRARSFWEEAAGLMPKRPQYNWINDALELRATKGLTGAGTEDPDGLSKHSILPVRERITAAWVFFWRIARSDGWRPGTKAFNFSNLSPGASTKLREFTDRLKGEEEHPLSDGKPRDSGLRYAANFLENVLDNGGYWYPHQPNEDLLKNQFPNGSTWWFTTNSAAEIVREALAGNRRLILKHPLRHFIEPSLDALILQSCLTIDGIARRESLATIQYAHLHSPAAETFAEIIEKATRASNDKNEYRWLIESAVFSLGWMMHPESTLSILLELSAEGLDNSIRLTSLMAIGDMAEKIRPDPVRLDRTRTKIRALIKNVLPVPGGRLPTVEEKLVIRAATYVLAMLRNEDDIDVLTDVADPFRFSEDTTPALGQWGLDRINLRQEVSAHWLKEEPKNRSFEGRPYRPESLRRLVDPLDSLATVKSIRLAGPKSKVKAKTAPLRS